MTRIALLPERTDDSTSWRAISGEMQSVGRTAGEALDAIAAQLGEEEGGTLIIMQSRRPDKFFNQDQQTRLGILMAKWRSARDRDANLPSIEQTELAALVQAEVEASTMRAKTVFDTTTP